MAYTIGSWWLSEEGNLMVADSVTTLRGGKALRAVRHNTIGQRTWSLRTVATDTRVSQPGGTNSRCWNVPDDNPPDDPASTSDWLLTGANYIFDPDTGEIRVTATCIQPGDDWTEVVGVAAYGGL